MIFAKRSRDLRPRSAPQELADRSARAEKLACEIDVDHCIPLRERHFVKRRIPLQSGIRDDNVEGAEHSTGLLEHLRDLVLIRHIGAMHDGPAAKPIDLVGDGMRLVIAGNIVDDNGGTRLRHCDRHRLADPGIGAGDERLLAGKRHACCSRPSHDLAFPDVHFPLPVCMPKR